MSEIGGQPADQVFGGGPATHTPVTSRAFEYPCTHQSDDSALPRVRWGLGQSPVSRIDSTMAPTPSLSGVARGWRAKRGSTGRANGERESKGRAAESPLLSAELRTTTGKYITWESWRAGNGDLYAGNCVCTLLCVRTCLTHTHTRDGLRHAVLLSCSATPWKRPLLRGNTRRARRRAVTGRALPLSSASIYLARSRPFAQPPRHSSRLSELLSALSRRPRPSLELLRFQCLVVPASF